MTEKQEITPCPKCEEAATYTLIIKTDAWYLNCGVCGEFITLWRDDYINARDEGESMKEEKITREAKIAQELEWALKVARFNNPVCTGQGLPAVFAMPILQTAIEFTSSPWRKIAKDFESAWAQYKVFPSMANERLFAKAILELEKLEQLVDPKNYCPPHKPTPGMK